ncbi:unnamed protein product [Blepharisma stoltei]|uniref:Uncharacterized protein n=1 Tax=Blepharisma stoltei TaxID=1481888 RepID=A0AAU9ICX8_9CILI|nr:unnamed protein product [Blepharisma stoltei]
MIQRELGSIYLTDGESYELYLSDYFSGNNLSFANSDSNMTTGSAILENKCEFYAIIPPIPKFKLKWNLSPLISQTFNILKAISWIIWNHNMV